MDNKITTEETTGCCSPSCKCLSNNKWLWMIVRIALLLVILAGVFHMGVRVGSMGGDMRGHRGMMHKGGMMGGQMGCPMMNKGNWNKDDNMMRGDRMMDKPANTAPATGEVVNTGEVIGTGQ